MTSLPGEGKKEQGEKEAGSASLKQNFHSTWKGARIASTLIRRYIGGLLGFLLYEFLHFRNDSLMLHRSRSTSRPEQDCLAVCVDMWLD